MNTLWFSDIQAPEFPYLVGDIKTDVLIIGGGIAGVLTAHFLHERGIPYILVESDRICSGTTGHTTAKLTLQHGLIYSKLLKSSGLHTARQYLLANKAALDKYAELCRDIHCDYEQKDNYVYSLNNARKLDDEMSAFNKLRFRAALVHELPLPFYTAGAVRVKNQAQFHPLKFLYSLARKLRIYEHTHVRGLIGNTAIIANGNIHADRIIVATHFPFINKHGSYFIKLYQHRTYTIALDKAQELHGMYVDESKTGLSFRNYRNLLLLSGGSHRTGMQGGGYKELRNFAQGHYPYAVQKHYWATQDCMSLDSMPYIGRYSSRTHKLYTATGFNKWGMTGSMLAAMLLSDAVCNRQHEYSDIFSPSRSILKPQLLVNGFEATKNLLTVSEKRCPHLHCALKWNKAEHSWDCPCHGSRFASDGKLLNNPANGDIPPNKL